MSLHIEYEQVLRKFLDRQGEVDLMKAYELGKQFQNEQISPDQLIGLHLEALQKLPADLSEGERLREVMHSFSVLIETMIAYGVAYADANFMLAQSSREAEEAKFELERTIVDLDLPFGTVGLDFNDEASQGVSDALSAPERLDDVLLDRLLLKRGDHLSLFTAPAALERDYLTPWPAGSAEKRYFEQVEKLART